jgi:excisionase family DNA binding protein
MHNLHNPLTPFQEWLIVELLEIKSRLPDPEYISKALKSQTEQVKYLNVDQAAEVLDLAKSTVYAKVSQGVLPHFKKGARLYFSRKSLEDFIQSGRKKTVSEIEAEAVNSVGPKRVRK